MYNPEQLPHDMSLLASSTIVKLISDSFGFIPEQVKIKEIHLCPNEHSDFNIMTIGFSVKSIGYSAGYAGNGKYKLQNSSADSGDDE